MTALAAVEAGPELLRFVIALPLKVAKLSAAIAVFPHSRAIMQLSCFSGGRGIVERKWGNCNERDYGMLGLNPASGTAC